MAGVSDASLLVQIGADISRLEKGISKAQRKVRDAGRKMQQVGSKLTASVSLPLAAAGGVALKTAAEFESLQQSLSVLNGSAEEGATQFKRLQDFASTTPFQLKELVDAQSMLQGFGLSADEAYESLQNIGDIAAVSSGSIKGIGVAFGQAAAEGQLMSRDIRQLINQDVPAIRLLANSMGVAEDAVFDLASQGEISFEDMQQAFRDATSEGGLFFEGMAKQANTLHGVFSNFRDNVDIIMSEVGKAIDDAFDIKGLIRNVTAQLQVAIDWFNSLSAETRRAALTVAGLLGAGGPILIAVGTLTAALGAISWPVVLGVAAFSAVATAIMNHWDEVVSYFTTGDGAKIFSSLKGIANEFKDAFIAIWNEIGDGVIATIGAAFKIVSKTVSIALDGILTLMQKFNGNFNTELNIWEDNFLTTLSKIDAKIVSFVKDSLSWLFTNMVKGFKRAGIAVAGAFGIASKGAQRFNGVLKAGNSVTDAATGYLNSLSTGYGVLARNANKAAAATSKVNDNATPGGTSSGGGTQSLFGGSNPVKQIKATDVATRALGSTFDTTATKLQKASSKYGSVSQAMQVTTQKAQVMGQALQSSVTSAVTGFAETLGNAFTGDAGAEGFFNNLILIVTDFTKQFGKLLVAAGIAAQAFKSLLANPVAAIIAGGALIAASTAVKNLLQKGPSNNAPALAQGGLAFGPTMAMVGDNKGARTNPEVIAPLDKLQGMMEGAGSAGTVQVVGKIRGDDIYISNKRGKNRFR